MASLFNTRISDTYSGLIKTIDNAAITASLKEITDGNGTGTGLFVNTAGDFKVTTILEFGSLKDTGENITITKFVDENDGIANNDNDTTIPTTAAIIDYVAAQITIEDLDFTGDSGSGQIDLDSQIFAINGTANEITTVASGQSITFSLNSTGVVLPNNSTATTQTAGDNSTKIATTSYVDTLDAASDLDFSGDSGTGDVNLNTQVFAITGTANQIESTASGQGLSLQFPSAGVTLPNGSVATTQASSDDSTKVATTAYVKGLNNASDLDFTTDSGSGAVVLNSQTLSVLGTTNEIETSGSGQAVTIGLPSTINVNVTGNLTGNVTGNVTGDLTGNSDTATKWQTARDLSLTGQATGTISSVDGSANVSGAVTLDNNSVTAKVLTGLTSPSASSVLATDTILEGFGKVQSQINGLAGGLRFMGDWNATTNSPVLSSGGGEAANGTTTSTTANKLVDSSASFTSTVTVGDQVVNQVDGQTALVSNVDSDTTLSLSADIMLTGEAYTIDNSPFITQGHYYVVSVGGTTSLNGVSNWSVGDWVIAGANNQWTKLDHSQVDGTGTAGNLTKWASTSVIADSIVSESGTAITVDGSLATNSFLSSTGNFSVNTDKFTVAASSGDTAIAGNLDFPNLSDILMVDNSSAALEFKEGSNLYLRFVTTNSGEKIEINKNIEAQGITSTSATFTGNVNLGDNDKLILGTGNDLEIYHDESNSFIKDAGTGDLVILSDTVSINNAANSENIAKFLADSAVKLYYDNVQKFQTTSTGIEVSGTASTFEGDVGLGGTGLYTSSHSLNIDGTGLAIKNDTNGSNNNWSTIKNTDTASSSNLVFNTGLGVALTLNNDKSATFADDVSLADDKKIRLGTGNDLDIYHNGTTGNSNIDNNTGNLFISNLSDNNDIFFRGKDGGSVITALTLDMSNGGSATFRDDIDFGGKITQTGSGANTFAGDVQATGIYVGATNTSFDFYNQGTSYFNGAVTVDAALTQSGGDASTFSGTVTFNDHTFHPNQVKSIFGTGSDFQIYHDGSNSYIQNLTGWLNIPLSQNGISIANADFSESIARFLVNGAVELFYDGAKKFETVSTGVDVFGTSGNTNVRVYDGSANSEVGLKLQGDAATWTLQNWGSGGDKLRILNNAGTSVQTWQENGSVGIGTVDPDLTGFGWNVLTVMGGTGAGDAGVLELAAPSTDANDQNLGIIAFMGGTARNAQIASNRDAATNDGRLSFWTSPGAGGIVERMRITSGGNIGINTGSNTPDALLTLEASSHNQAFAGKRDATNYLWFLRNENNSGRFQIYNSSSAQTIEMTGANGNISISGTLTEGSDVRIKENIKPLKSQLEIVNKLNPVSYNKIGFEESEIGFVAQEVEEILPELVKDDEKGMKSIAYSKMNTILVKAIQELKSEVDKLKQECKCK